MSDAFALRIFPAASFTPVPPQLLCVAVKRSYALSEDGKRLSLADEQQPLVAEPDIEVDEWDNYRTLRDDTDLLPPKVATDVVAFGHAYAASEGARRSDFALAVGNNARRLLALGQRRVEVDTNTLRFSEPEPFDKVPLDYEYAYGGHDAEAQRVMDLDRALIAQHAKLGTPPPEGLFAYPRNVIGRGYLFAYQPARADGMLLPQLEDPADLLHPARLLVPGPEHWAMMPLPASLSWQPHTFYPRIARLVGKLTEPALQYPRERDFGDAEGLDKLFDSMKGERPHPRSMQGAPPGMACERLRGDELVIAEQLHPHHAELRFSLPAERPKVNLKVPELDRSLALDMVLQTVRLQLDNNRVVMTWCGAFPLGHQPPEAFLQACRAEVRFRKL